MAQKVEWERRIPQVFWACLLITIVVQILLPGDMDGWDLDVYKAAMMSLRAGHDPYEDAMAIQRSFHAQGQHPPGTPVPFSYVYSPMTLHLVALFGKLPIAASTVIYSTVFVAAVVAMLLAGWWAVEERERKLFAFLMPAVVFFPCLLVNDAFLSWNLAYILYGAVYAAAWLGWTRGFWWPFHVAVLLASIFKAPLLSLVAIAPLSARRQWVPTIVTFVLGVVFFASQTRIYPVLFQHYLEAVELQFSFNHDFGSSPAGLTAKALYHVIPYKVTSAVTYAATTFVFGGILLMLRRRFFSGLIGLKQWIPLVMAGTVLLNPRIMEYDLASITTFLALLTWRFCSWRSATRQAGLKMAAFFIVMNVFAVSVEWRHMACMTIVAVFFAGAWLLWRESGEVKDAEPRGDTA